MVRLTRLFAIGLASALSVDAAAQYGPTAPRQDVPQGTSPSAPTAPSTAAPRADVLRAAACAADRDSGAADTLLATAPYSSAEREQAVRLLRSAERCLRLRSPIATSALLFRGAIAETLYETRFAQPVAARDPAAAATSFFRAADVAGREDAALLATSFELAHCTAPRHPDLIRALLATEPGTEAETAALSALYPSFGACVPAGTQLRVDRGGIRAMLAESLYRWSVVQRDGATSPWAAPAAAAAAQ
jgi:hypothetical protein